MAGNKFLKLLAGVITEEAGVQASAGAGDAGKLGALDTAGRWDITMMPLGLTIETLVLPSSENLVAGDMVNLWDDAGTVKVRKADASGGVAKKADGYVLAAVTSPANATVYFGNVNNQKSGLTLGANYFLSGTAGAITTTAPSTATHIVQQVGKAYSATALLTEIQQPIVLV